MRGTKWKLAFIQGISWLDTSNKEFNIGDSVSTAIIPDQPDELFYHELISQVDIVEAFTVVQVAMVEVTPPIVINYSRYTFYSELR